MLRLFPAVGESLQIRRKEPVHSGFELLLCEAGGCDQSMSKHLRGEYLLRLGTNMLDFFAPEQLLYENESLTPVQLRIDPGGPAGNGRHCRAAQRFPLVSEFA